MVIAVTIKFRLISPDRKRKSKLIGANDIETALSRGRIGEDWFVEYVQSGVIIPVSEFVVPKEAAAKLPKPVPAGRTTASAPKERLRPHNEIFYVFIIIGLMFVVGIVAIFMQRGKSTLSDQQAGTDLEQPTVQPVESPLENPVSEPMVKPVERAVEKPDGKLVAELVNDLLQYLKGGTTVQLKDDKNSVVVLEVVGSDCLISIEYHGQMINTISVEISTSALNFDGVKFSDDRTRCFHDAVMVSFVLANAKDEKRPKSSGAMIRWMIQSHPSSTLGRFQSRMFGSTLVAIACRSGKTLITFRANPDPVAVAEARQNAESERQEAIEKARGIESWTDLQFALRGFEEFDVMPTISASLIGSIGVGDSMLSVAEKLSIHGTEMLNLQGISQVQWKDDYGQILLTFEGGRVAGKIGF